MTKYTSCTLTTLLLPPHIINLCIRNQSKLSKLAQHNACSSHCAIFSSTPLLPLSQFSPQTSSTFALPLRRRTSSSHKMSNSFKLLKLTIYNQNVGTGSRRITNNVSSEHVAIKARVRNGAKYTPSYRLRGSKLVVFLKKKMRSSELLRTE